MSGGRSPKQKGNRIERECVNLAKGYGLETKRAWGSDGRSLGWSEEVDMTIDLPNKTFPDKSFRVLKFQVKGRKKIADYLKPSEEIYGQILKEDRGDPLVTIRYSDFLSLLTRMTG
jgi:hypothetical protein